MKMLRVLGLSAFATLFTQCASIQSVSLTQIPKERKKVVETTASRFIFLGLNFNNDYINQLTDDLKAQCQGGVVSGILTKDETYNYFLGLAITRQVTAKGYCVK